QRNRSLGIAAHEGTDGHELDLIVGFFLGPDGLSGGVRDLHRERFRVVEPAALRMLAREIVKDCLRLCTATKFRLVGCLPVHGSLGFPLPRASGGVEARYGFSPVALVKRPSSAFIVALKLFRG